MKTLTISDETRRIHYLSLCTVGRQHDYSLFKDEFPPEAGWFENFNIEVDLGFLGASGDSICRSLSIPDKKPRNGELSDAQKSINRAISSKRIRVEHSIGGLKRYRILSDRLRLHLIDLYDEILGVCAGLWNLYLDN